MRSLPLALLLLLMSASCASTSAPVSQKGLKDVLADDFLVGCAVNSSMIDGRRPKADSITRRHFNSIVAENCMKSAEINPAPGVYNWAPADSFVAYGNRHGMAVIGHTLIWHSQLAPWFAVDAEGHDVSPDTLRARMKAHITAMLTRYKGKVKGWDVVNEPILDDGTYRDSPFYRILGEEFIPLAFSYAHEADPDAELYINDYSMTKPAKRDAYVRLVKAMKARGLRIDGIGMQAHISMEEPTLAEFEQAIDSFASTGANVMITEWDMSALPVPTMSANIADSVAPAPDLNPYTEGLPDSVAMAWNRRMADFMDLFRRHSDQITRVTVWGTDDSMSWRNFFPVRGRTDYPLLFDRDFNAKPFVDSLISTNF